MRKTWRRHGRRRRGGEEEGEMEDGGDGGGMIQDDDLMDTLDQLGPLFPSRVPGLGSTLG